MELRNPVRRRLSLFAALFRFVFVAVMAVTTFASSVAFDQPTSLKCVRGSAALDREWPLSSSLSSQFRDALSTLKYIKESIWVYA
jgi:hypothetical protein